MGQYPGITTKILKNGSKSIMVRFKYHSKTYPIKNFTKLYGCKTERQAFEKLQEIKIEISKDKDPFTSSVNNLNNLFDERLENFKSTGKWSYHSCRNNLYFYNKHIRKQIGHKKIEKIKYDDVKKILDAFNVNQTSSKSLVCALLNPIFKEELIKGNIHKNVFDGIERYKIPVREKIEKRTNMKEIDIIRELYINIDNYSFTKKDENLPEVKTFLYLVIMTSHRWGEILQLKKEDCYLDEMKIISPKEITKTKIEDYHFPLPKECFEYISNCKTENLFNTKRGTVYGIFQNLISLTDINLYKNKKISLHDTRKLMLSIMVRDLRIDSMLGDYCLDHRVEGTMKHYMEFNYDDKVYAYNKYWNHIRNTSG